MADATPGEQVAPQKRPGSEQAVEQPRSEPDSRSGGGPAVRGFRWWLGAIAALAFAIRLATLFTVADFTPDGGDPYWYHTQANELVAGNGFVDPFILKTEGVRVPGAQHPPLYTMWLAVPSLVGLDSYDAHKVISCLAGVLAVAVIGLAARRLSPSLDHRRHPVARGPLLGPGGADHPRRSPLGRSPDGQGFRRRGRCHGPGHPHQG